jgi:hypothetical protein
LGKTGIFAHPRSEKRPFVGQNRHFCPSAPRKTAIRWAKPALLPIRGREISPSLGKTGHFAHPQPENQPFVGQNGAFCPSVAEKTAFRWAKQVLLPISAERVG